MQKMQGVIRADVSLRRGSVDFEYEGAKPTAEELNRKFEKQGYRFFEEPPTRQKGEKWNWKIFAAALVVIGGFLAINKLGLSSLVNVNSNSSLPAFFVFGLIAGISSCAALVGGLVLSFSETWNKESGKNKTKPHLLFNAGRLISFSLLGAVLGFVGEKFIISSSFISVLVLFVSAVMLILAFQMLGIEAFNRFRVALPKSLSGQTAEKEKGEGAPFAIGFMTFLLPCGFTIVAEGAAILSGSPARGAVIMLLFALGTMFPLLAIGFSSTRLLNDRKLSEKFLKVAGLLIIFFVIYNIDFQFGITRSISENFASPASISQTEQGNNPKAEPDSSKKDSQVIKTVYKTSSDIQPNTFEVKKGQSVRFEVEVKDNGSGCMSTIMVPGLWDKPLSLKAGKTLVMEFTPEKAGSYKITCAMGVPRGTINVID